MKTYPIEELFIGSGSKFPFRAQWWKPGKAAHRVVYVFTAPSVWYTEDGLGWGMPMPNSEDDTWVLPWTTQPVIRESLKEILSVS